MHYSTLFSTTLKKMPIIHNQLFKLFFPIFLVFLLFTNMENVAFLVEVNFNLAVQLPYFLFVICVILCQSFNQGRMGMIAVAMGVAYWVIQSRLQHPLAYGTTELEYVLLAFTFPTACITVYLFPEKRILSLAGIIYCCFLVLLLAWSSLFVEHIEINGVSNLWDTILFQLNNISHLPFIIILYNALFVGLFGIFVLKKNMIIDTAIYNALIVSTLTFVFIQYAYISTILFSLGGLLLIINIMITNHNLAYVDQLTNIPGRRALETEIKHLGKKYTIAMLDVDHFKKFNDTYGHDTGDDVLKLVAAQMARIGGKAQVFRYGGEEFTVLFKRKYLDETLEHLEELRENIANYEMAIRDHNIRPKSKLGLVNRGKGGANKSVSVTISIGVADSYETKKPLLVLKAADEALYKAKKSGRNCIAY